MVARLKLGLAIDRLLDRVQATDRPQVGALGAYFNAWAAVATSSRLKDT